MNAGKKCTDVGQVHGIAVRYDVGADTENNTDVNDVRIIPQMLTRVAKPRDTFAETDTSSAIGTPDESTGGSYFRHTSPMESAGISGE